MNVRLKNINLFVSDLERSREFYEQLIGLPMMSAIPHRAWWLYWQATALSAYSRQLT